MSSEPRSRAARLGVAALEVVFCVALPLVALSWAFHNAVTGGAVTDFEEAFYPAAERILDGSNPYPGADDPAVTSGVAYVYPPLTAILVVPFTVLSAGAAGVVAMSLLVAAVIATLWVLGVRDWRCYGIVFAWPAVYSAIMAGTVTIPLGLGAALVWRLRNTAPLAGIALGLSAALKLILWPLGVWLGATHRILTALVSLTVAVAAIAMSWAVIGFAGAREYPELLRRVQELEEGDSYTVYALATDLGWSSAPARAMALFVALALLGGVIYLGRRGDERRAFVLCMAAVLACTPIVWLHYFALLVVVVAVSEPRLAPVWFVPLAMYTASATTNGSTFQTATTIAVAALTVGVALRPGSAVRKTSMPTSSPPPLGEAPT